jgi:hypothetical protein
MSFYRVHKVHPHRFIELFVYAFLGVVLCIVSFVVIKHQQGEALLPPGIISEGNALPINP